LPRSACWQRKLKRLGRNNPILLKDCLEFEPGAAGAEDRLAARRGGHRLVAGRRHRRRHPGPGEAGAGQSLRLAYNILQAAGCRSFKTDYVACPSCGRTLFNLQTVTGRIKARTEHLKGVKIAIMGCIVNGPGEMADADFGYVGGAPGKINLYVGKTAVKFNIPEAEAVDRLVDLIRSTANGPSRNPMQEGVGIGRATGNIDIHRDDLVHAAEAGVVLAEDAAAAAARAHGYHQSRRRCGIIGLAQGQLHVARTGPVTSSMSAWRGEATK
jgi:hypothetical protein